MVAAVATPSGASKPRSAVTVYRITKSLPSFAAACNCAAIAARLARERRCKLAGDIFPNGSFGARKLWVAGGARASLKGTDCPCLRDLACHVGADRSFDLRPLSIKHLCGIFCAGVSGRRIRIRSIGRQGSCHLSLQVSGNPAGDLTVALLLGL